MYRRAASLDPLTLEGIRPNTMGCASNCTDQDIGRMGDGIMMDDST